MVIANCPFAFLARLLQEHMRYAARVAIGEVFLARLIRQERCIRQAMHMKARLDHLQAS